VLVADEPPVAALAGARDLSEAGHEDGPPARGRGRGAWCAAGLPVAATPDLPADPDCIDFLFFTPWPPRRQPGRPRGNISAWGKPALVGQLDAQERGVFRVAAGVT